MDRKRKANGEACTHAANAAMFEELRRQYNAPFNTKKKNLGWSLGTLFTLLTGGTNRPGRRVSADDYVGVRNIAGGPDPR